MEEIDYYGNSTLERMVAFAPIMHAGDIMLVQASSGEISLTTWEKDCPHCLYLTEPEEHRKEMCRKCLSAGSAT